MDKSFLLEIVTPYGLVVSSKVEEAYIAGSQGDFGVLPGHIPFLTSLRIGELHYRRNKDIPTRTTILTDTAEPAEEIDTERAQTAKTRAEEGLKKLSKDDPAYLKEMEAWERARVRLRIAEKTPRK